MSSVEILPVRGRIQGEATIPRSKPHMQRAILLSLLTNGPSVIVEPAWSSESHRLYEAAQRLGLTVGPSDVNRLIVSGVGRSLAPHRTHLQADGSAFNFRTLTAVACLSPNETVIEADGSMLRRPVRQYLSFVSQIGANIEDRSDGSTLRVAVSGGRQLGGDVWVDTRHSSQVLTAVLLIAPLAQSDLQIHCQPDALVGEGYVDLTLSMMRDQGAVIEPNATGMLVSPALYQSRLHHIASDFTALSYLAGAVAVVPDGDITVTDYSPSGLSSESEFIEVLAALGVQTQYDPVHGRLRILEGTLGGRVEIDARNIPTVVPTLAAMAPFIETRVTVRNAAHVNNHKCRRVEVMIDELQRMGCDIEPIFDNSGDVDGFISEGRQTPVGGVQLDSHGDHRIFMSLATAALGAQNAVSVNGSSHLGASFPQFLSVMAGLGVQFGPIEMAVAD